MRYPGFCGPSNPSQSVLADGERTVNWLYERVEAPSAPTGDALYPTPGFQPYLTVTDVGTRGGISVGGRAFVVIGAGVYEVFADQTAIRRGTVAQDSNPATVSSNGTTGGHLFLTSGGHGYCYVLATNTLTQVLTDDATMGGMINSRFLAFDGRTGIVRMSGLNDGLTWDPTLVFARSQAPDPWQAMIVRPPEIWLIGEQTGEVWYDSGAFPQPFAPISGALFPYGTPAPFSVVDAGDVITWVHKGRGGQGRIVAARGYSPSVISNYAVDTAIAGYARTSPTSLANAEAFTYEDQGHTFAVFAFPDGPGTWAVDVQTGSWDERGAWNPTSGSYDVWAPRVHLYAFNKHLIGTRTTSTVSEMDVTFGSEPDGGVIRRLRIPPPLWASSRQRLVVSRLQLLAEPGLGLATGQGSDPMVMMRSSRDGKRWSSERMASAGKLGDYRRRIVWMRCGSSDGLWVPEITCTDPIPWRLSGADLEGTGLQAIGRAA